MGYVAVIHVSHEELLLQPTITSIDSVHVRREYEISPSADETHLYVSVTGTIPPDFPAILDEDPTISEFGKVVEFGDRSIYRVTIDTPIVPVPPIFSTVKGYLLAAESNGAGWKVRSHLPDRDAITALKEEFNQQNVDFRVVRLFDTNSIDRLNHAGLTEKQRDLLLNALYAGYYDIPRRASQADLADQLEISTSAVSKQLRRAVSQLIVNSLSPEETRIGRDP